jgi:hypothetical protein
MGNIDNSTVEERIDRSQVVEEARLNQIAAKVYDSRGAPWLRGEGPSFADVEWLLDRARQLEHVKGALQKIAEADVTEKPQTVAYAMQKIARAALHPVRTWEAVA